ncbi:GIY-YIG nuclease family protein [Jannaschia formosa]|uniref:GIY-YIG nuclease family protein n=1 Tax=Jannaschia formosa TaxID=2259592 RepID=UPI000E1BFFF9|nr:GIY-YIG nuclease family protein [Jannaschia formosa]TFL16580.1 GIY-YIG nuclease family protein [Jannaschia formosa]
MPRPTLDDIFDEPDEFGLLEVRLKPRGTRPPELERDASVVREVNNFYDLHGRLPSDDATDHDEMRLGTIWRGLVGRADPGVFADVDPNGLLEAAPGPAQEPAQARDWRDDPLEDEIPESLDDIFDEDEGEIPEAFTQIRNITPVAERHLPDHRAEFFPCPDFETFQPAFEELQADLEAGVREVTAISSREVIDVQEGSYFIRNGLLAYIAEKTEMTARGGKRDHRLRVIFSNGTESDPLISSFRKALASDPTARVVHRPGLGPLDPDWEADQLDLTGTIYVARSRSEQPAIAEVRDILLKIGVTTQDVHRRVADARNDPTFLLAPVDIVATYELRNLSRRKVEDLLHRFFDAARPRDLWITDRFGKRIFPREWFYVLPEHVSRAVKAIKDGTLHELRYDPETQRIVRRG